MNFHEMILWNGLLMPGRPAIVMMERVVTYGMLRQGILSVAGVLRQKGIKRNSIVAIHIDIASWHLIVGFALAEIGATSCSVAAPSVLSGSGITVDAIVTRAPLTPPAGTPVHTITESWFSQPTTRFEPVGFDTPEALGRIEVSSGTTGHPKAIALNVRSIEARQMVALRREAWIGWQRTLLMFPPSAAWGFSRALTCLSMGLTLHLPRSIDEAAQMLSLFAIDFLAGANNDLSQLADRLRAEPRPINLKAIQVGGAMMTTRFLEVLRSTFACEVMYSYGSTEASIIAGATSSRISDVDGIGGFVPPWVTLEVLGADGAVLPIGAEGIIRCRSATMGTPYPPGAENASFDDAGWHYPGDLGRLTEDGVLIITGRADHLLNVHGKIAPELVEDRIRTAPGVSDVGAAAIRNRDGVNDLWIAVTGAARLDEMQLLGWCRMIYPSLSVKRVIQVATIPRNANGKIIRAELQALFEARTAD